MLKVLEGVSLLSLAEGVKLAIDDPKVLLIFFVSSIVTGSYQKPEVREALKESEYIATVGASVLNGGYSGIRIYSWLGERSGIGTEVGPFGQFGL